MPATIENLGVIAHDLAYSAQEYSISRLRVPPRHARLVAPAIANTIYHVTRNRIRDRPITVEKLL
jgi:hypothetical protein